MKKTIFIISFLLLLIPITMAGIYDDCTIYGTCKVEKVVSQTFYANTSNIIYGTLSEGELNSTYWVDENYYVVNEETGTPALDIRFNFTDVDRFDSILLKLDYEDGAKEVELQMWHWDLEHWDGKRTFQDLDGFENFEIPIYNYDDYTNDNGTVMLRFYQGDAGNINYYLYLDLCVLLKGAVAITTNQHDSLSGRNSPDNHPWAVPFTYLADLISNYFTKTEIQNAYVPYTGATANIDITPYDFTTIPGTIRGGIISDGLGATMQNGIVQGDDLVAGATFKDLNGNTLTVGGVSWISNMAFEFPDFASLIWWETLGGNSLAWDGSGNINMEGGGTLTNVGGNIKAPNGDVGGLTITQTTDANTYLQVADRIVNGYYYGSNANAGLAFIGHKARGTAAAPSVPITGDILVSSLARVWTSAGFKTGGRFSFKADGTITSTSIPTRLDVDLAPVGYTSLFTFYSFQWDKLDINSGVIVMAPVTQPASPESGMIYFDDSDSHFYGYNGADWVQLDN